MKDEVMKGGRGKQRTIQTKAGRTVKPIRGLKRVELACNEYLRERGLMRDFRHDDFIFGEKEKARAKLRREFQKEDRYDEIALEMGQD
jgi:hypothetical protein